MKVLENALNRALDLNSNKEVDILIDNPPVDVDENIIEMVARMVENQRKIRWFAIGISSSSNHLKVHDFVTGTVSDMIEGNNPTYYKIIESKVVK